MAQEYLVAIDIGSSYVKSSVYAMAGEVLGSAKRDIHPDQPRPGVAAGIKIGLVTSGLYEKAYPCILSAFRTLELGDPAEFYDVFITGGFPLRPGEIGTLGELSPKPHPWLYAEAGRIGLGIPFEQRHTVVGIDDSGAGICSVRLAGFRTVGISGGNIIESGTRTLCHHYGDSFRQILAHLGLMS